ncbi:MAG TPA: hypothetical protein VFN11_14610 [Ktedonobacterales bacterium]|nr:hypothetical protein [Ktedonobacterales bacterium]
MTMPDPSEPDPTSPLPPAHRGTLQGRVAQRAVLIAVSLLLIGGGLAYLALFRRWGYSPMTPSALSTLSPQDRASLTVSWWDTTNDSCGPFPAIWPALAILSAVPLLIAAMRQRSAASRWATVSLLCAFFGAGTVLFAVLMLSFHGAYSSGFHYRIDIGTVVISLSGYAVLALGALVLRRASPSALASRRSTPSAGE